MKPKTTNLEIVPLEELILTVRCQRVVLDADLARIYGVPTKHVNQAVKRNRDRFPADFAFLLEPQEVAALRSQIVTSKPRFASEESDALTSKTARSKKGWGGRRTRPYAFTEHGAIMAANVLNSPRAVQMSVFVVRVFVKMREVLGQNKEMAAKLAELEHTLTLRLDNHEHAFSHILDEIKKLMAPPPEPKRREIGFHVRDEADPTPHPSRGDEAQTKKRVRASSHRLPPI